LLSDGTFAISDHRITINHVIERGFIFGVFDLAQITARHASPYDLKGSFLLPRNWLCAAHRSSCSPMSHSGVEVTANEA
jgi:hypothetical protein